MTTNFKLILKKGGFSTELIFFLFCNGIKKIHLNAKNKMQDLSIFQVSFQDIYFFKKGGASLVKPLLDPTYLSHCI